MDYSRRASSFGDYLQRAYRYIVGQDDIEERKEERKEAEEKETRVDPMIPQPRRILTRYETLGDIESSIDPFGKRFLKDVRYYPERREEKDELILNEEEVLKNKTCNDPITLEHQDEDSKTFISDPENKEHILLIGKFDDKYYIDCAYRDNLRYIIGSKKVRCDLEENYYTVTTSFDPYLKISETELTRVINSKHQIYYLIPTNKSCGNGKIYKVKTCGGEDCLQKIFN